MPLTQLRRLVLPAPLGPTRAKISPLVTLRLTPPSTRRPPKASRTSSTTRREAGSAMPATLAVIRLDVAIAARLPARAHPEVELADVGVLQQASRGVLVDDPPALHDVAVVGDAEGGRRVLLDEQDGETELGPQPGQDLE